MSQKEKLLAYGAWIAICVIWGTAYLAIRVAVRTIPDAWLAGVRFLTAGGLMSLILWAKGEKFPPLSQWKHLALVGVLLIGIGNWSVVVAEHFVPSGPTALLIATLPFWMLFLESVLAKRVDWIAEAPPTVGLYQVIGLIIGFCGVLLLVLPQLRGTFNGKFLLGVLVLQVGTVAWSLGSLYSKHKKVEAGPLVSASLQMLLGGAFVCVIGLIKADFHTTSWDRSGFIALLYLVFVGSMVAYGCYIYALHKLPSSVVVLHGYINPMIAVWLGWLILKEEVTWTTLLATAVILSGSWIVRRR